MQPSLYRLIRAKRSEVNGTLDNFPILREVFGVEFFDLVDQQITEMEKDGIDGPIHPMFRHLHISIDGNNNQLQLLEGYLGRIINHPSATASQRRHIITELSTGGHLFRMFEINILGNLLAQLSPDRIQLDPKTINEKCADVSVELIDRPVFIEVTMLGESKLDQEKRESAMRAKQRLGGGSLNLDAGIDRFANKIRGKSAQLSPNSPNVVIIQTFDWLPLGHQIEQVVQQYQFPNVGLILQMDREELVRAMTTNCDPECQLAPSEITEISRLLSGTDYRPLIFGTTEKITPYEPQKSQ